MPRTIVIGDIHGCAAELDDLLHLINLKSDDRVIAVGDLIVKGPKNREVLDRFIEDKRLSSVVGNHDRVIRQHLRGEPVPLNKPQRKAVKQLREDENRYANFLRALPYTIDLGSHLIVHAGLRPGVSLDEQSASDLTEIRTMGADPARRKGVAWYDVYRGEKVVLFGHWPAAEPRRAERAIGLDTGCVYGGQLTAYIIEAEEFVSVPAHEVYDGPKLKKKFKRKSHKIIEDSSKA
jgi:diadenosine tetraphosphatase ApaH/serine/threonine PP2A family protein phosphatase